MPIHSECVPKRDIRIERIRYMADLRRFISQELGHMGRKRILDAGCGTGLVGRMMKKAYPTTTIIGIDSDKKSVRTAERKARLSGLKIRYITGGLDSIPLAGSSLDIVVAAIVFHHMTPRTRVKALREFHRTLARNGNLIVLEGKGLARGLTSMIRETGFRNVKKKRFGPIRNVYTAVK